MDQSQTLYAPDTVKRLVELFQLNFGDYFASYWEATPNTEPSITEYPFIIVQKMDGTAVIGPTGTDEITETIIITIGLNKADDAGSANVKTTTMRKLQYLVEGQDPATQGYKQDTILYCLRRYITLLQSDGSAWLIDSDASIKYEQIPKPDTSIALADITVKTQRRVTVTDRQPGFD